MNIDIVVYCKILLTGIGACALNNSMQVVVVLLLLSSVIFCLKKTI